MVFPVVMYGCESWIINKAEHWRIDAFKLWCWRRFLRVPLNARTNQSILKKISPEYSLEGLMLKLKLQYFSHLMWRTDSLEKTLMLGKIEGKRRRGWQRMNGWMASPTQWTWVWASSRSWRWTGKPGVLQSMELQSRTWLSDWTDTATIGRGGSKINFDRVGLILGVLQSMGSQGLGHDLVTEQQQIFILVWRFAYLLV